VVSERATPAGICNREGSALTLPVKGFTLDNPVLQLVFVSGMRTILIQKTNGKHSHSNPKEHKRHTGTNSNITTLIQKNINDKHSHSNPKKHKRHTAAI
jgi:hypothetical protein